MGDLATVYSQYEADPAAASAKTSTSTADFKGEPVHNALLFLTAMLNNFTNGQMTSASVESTTILLLTQCEANLSQEMMSELDVLAASMQKIADESNPNSQAQNQMQVLNTEYSTTLQDGQINTNDIQGFVQAFQTTLQMTMSGLQSMSSMYDSISSSESSSASLIAGF